jgi:hypothetical protein
MKILSLLFQYVDMNSDSREELLNSKSELDCRSGDIFFRSPGLATVRIGESSSTEGANYCPRYVKI